MTALITGNPEIMLTVRDYSGRVVASSFEGSDGWQVMSRVGKTTCQIFVNDQAEARELLAVIAEVLT